MGISLKKPDYLGEPTWEKGASSVVISFRLLHARSGRLDESRSQRENYVLEGHTIGPWWG